MEEQRKDNWPLRGGGTNEGEEHVSDPSSLGRVLLLPQDATVLSKSVILH